MKIAIAQMNPVIGDFPHNCKKIKEFSLKAYDEGARLVIFSELAVSGYPPQDLLERNSFIEDQKDALVSLVKELPPIGVIVGGVERNRGEGKKLFNSAFYIDKNEIKQVIHKQLLPSYDVFDEKRYFEEGKPSSFIEIDGKLLAVTICEDIWFDEVKEYDWDPVQDIFSRAAEEKKQVDLLINISASPFQKGKLVTRETIFSSLCKKYGVSLAYINQVGGQDSLLFDGSSMVVDARGELSVALASFEEDMAIFELDAVGSMQAGFTASSDVEQVYQALVMGVRDYVGKCGFSNVVLGLSGGIDSALTALLAVDALGSENVLGVALPSQYSSQGSIDDARQLAENLGCRFELLPIAPLFNSFGETLSHLFEGYGEDLTEQNLQARIRGNLLMALSNKFGNLLLTTGNKSEMAVGYCTLYGDMSGGLAVISDVPKQLVYELARFVNRDRERIPQNTITKAPSAELKPDQVDQDDLPEYEVLDRILEMHLEQGLGTDQIVEQGFDQHIVTDILRRVRINEYKRKQAPMGLKVTSKAFGYGRRYPNVQNYQK